MDPSTIANHSEIVIKHVSVDWHVDFTEKRITGNVEHKCHVLQPCDRLVLDATFLQVTAVTSSDGTALEFELVPNGLVVHTGKLTVGTEFTVKISYSTTDKCTAVQWLTPEQTVGKKHPYLFTQCQAIHARSILPCQDTPSVKFTYSAKVTVPQGLVCLMSALPSDTPSVGNTFYFQQPVAIPSYLVALAVGNLAGERVGPRSTVWSEPEVVKQAAWEFADTESFIKTGESLLTPYEWGRYDLLVLPASFPYGGMENPTLTFVTPSLLAGDRSLVDVVAHEIAHSWMGNLVTTKSWENFWLNEGFTVFVERKIAGRLHGEQVLHFNAIIGYRALKESVDAYLEKGNDKYTLLVPNLTGEDPDDAFSSVPYEKGFNFLFYLEQLLGGPAVFEPYLKAHVEKFAHTSIDTTQFKDFMYEYFSKADASKVKVLDSVSWNDWFYKPGMVPYLTKPIVQNHFDNTLAVACESLAKKWDDSRQGVSEGLGKTEFEAFNSNQRVMFFEKLLAMDPFDPSLLSKMHAFYNLSSIQNAEVKCRWQLLALRGHYKDILSEVVAFVTSIGRMKFARPIYKALNKVDSKLAKETFIAHRTFYHPICATMVAKDLGI